MEKGRHGGRTEVLRLSRLVVSTCHVVLSGRGQKGEAQSSTCWVVAESEAQRAKPEAGGEIWQSNLIW
jgi:hypothetical protein